MFKAIQQKLIKWTHFPSVKQPPATIPSPQSILSIHLNIAFALVLYAILGNMVIALFSFLLLFLATISNKKNKKGSHEHHNHALKRPTILISLLLVCILLFIWQFGGAIGGRSLIGLLSMLISLKAMEAKNSRDYYVTAIMLYFFTAIIFAYNNSAFAPIILILLCTSITASLLLLNSSTQLSTIDLQTEHYQKIKSQQTPKKTLENLRKTLTPALKYAGKIIAQALPIAIVLFFLFPRIQGTFGFLPNDSDTANKGLGNDLTAGSLSARSASNELAFRVNFAGENKNKINTNNMYWRVKTFSEQQGFSWKKHDIIDTQGAQNVKKTIPKASNENSNIMRYLITHQATSDKQLASLETVVETQIGKILDNHTIQTNKNLSSTFQYSGTSILNTTDLFNQTGKQAAALSEFEYQSYLNTTFKPRNKTRQLLNTWLKQVGLPDSHDNPQPNSTQAKKLALLALQYFREESFSYHLLPPNLDQNEPIEDFLFRTRSGYCEHYASTFSTLMRWMNIPTRIVAGFQGAEYNAQGNFYEIRYSSAHAWSEIWTIDNGWIRVDPTAAVAPERIEFGMDALLALLQQNNSNRFSSGDFSRQRLSDAIDPSGSSGLFKFAGNWIKSANHSWDKWIVNYNFEQQTQLLQKLGLNTDKQHLTLLTILGVILAFITSIIIWIIWPKKAKQAPLDAAFYLFKHKLRKFNIPTPIAEGPADLQSRLLTVLPHNSADINYICQYYISKRYQTTNNYQITKKNQTTNTHQKQATNINSSTLSDFIKVVKHFKPITKPITKPIKQ